MGISTQFIVYQRRLVEIFHHSAFRFDILTQIPSLFEDCVWRATSIFFYTSSKKTIHKPQNTCVKEKKLLLLCRLRKGSLLDSHATQATEATPRARLVPGQHRRKALGLAEAEFVNDP